MFNKTDGLSKIKITIKGVTFGNGINSAMFPLLRNSIFKKTMVKKTSNSRSAFKADVFEHFITNACRTTGFVVRKLRESLREFFICNGGVQRLVPSWVNMREWKIMLLPKIIKKGFINRSKCSPVIKM